MMLKDNLNSKLKILPMLQIHAQTVCSIQNTCFSIPWSLNSFLEELANPEAITLVAEYTNSIIIGFVNARKVLDEVYINNIAVISQYRRCGVANALLDALHINVSHYAAFITLEVRESNHFARGLYEKLGYSNVGTRKNFYSLPTENAILYTRLCREN